MMSAWFETLKGLDESVLRQQLAENPVSCEIVEVYSLALAAKDTTIALAAQEELLKRGDSDYVGERRMEACQAGSLEFGTDFTKMIARSLTMVDYDPSLERTGEQLLGASESSNAKDAVKLLNDVKLDSVEREVDDETKKILRDYGKYIELSLANT